MSISNCLFSPTLEIPQEFPTWCVLTKLRALPSSRYARRRHYATTHSLDRYDKPLTNDKIV